MPNIRGEGGSRVDQDVTGAFYQGRHQNMVGGSWITSNDSLFFDASRSSSTYQDNAHVRPFSMTVAFLIRY